ncbi:MAG: hypothetical protein KDE31_10685, partial [Caldilineaceae bacterium]|nr:hypothetical protein [Caldilineaceae bacterium]
KSSPLAMALIAILFVAVGALAWLVLSQRWDGNGEAASAPGVRSIAQVEPAVTQPTTSPTNTPTPRPSPTATAVDSTAQRISDEVTQTITDYWSLRGATASCAVAWSMLSDSYARTEDRSTYLTDCARAHTRVTQFYDLDSASSSVIEMRGRCALTRFQLNYDDNLIDMTLALIESASSTGTWQIRLAYTDHSRAQIRANEVCY